MGRMFLLSLVLINLLLISCKKDKQVYTYSPTPYQLEIPEGFPQMPTNPNNPLTKEGVELGKRLYYDVRLSEGGPQAGNSCATCHVQSRSFADNSPGVSVLPHVNLGWGTKHWLWNGSKQGTLEDIMMFEVEDFFQVDVSRLMQDTTYQRMFYKAFGKKEITSKEVAYALAQFVRTLISGNSKYDKYKRGEIDLTPSEKRGMAIFFSERGDCFHCHVPPLFTDFDMHNIGLDSMPADPEDWGLFAVTGDSADLGKFRTPTLRNVALTGPYMHDGRFQTLDEVIDFYSEGVKNSPTLDPIMNHNGGIHLNLTPQEKEDLKAFLLTLTDEEFLNNPAYRP